MGVVGTIKVKAHQAVLGIRAGETGEVEDSPSVQNAIEAGRLEVVDDEGRSRKKSSAKADTGE